MNRATAALLTCLTLTPIAEGIDPKAISLCELLAHPEEHMGERVVVHGTIVQYEHGRYLVAIPRCDQEPSGVPVHNTDTQTYFGVGGRKGVGVPATVDGQLVMAQATRGINSVKGPYVAFSAKKVRYEWPQNKPK
jgi:hypothetical protein